MKRTGKIILLMLLMVLLHSCENVFHNDELDFLWRLDSVEFIDGLDFNGNECSKANMEGIWISFARDLVKVENKKTGFVVIGVLTEKDEQLTFDFSMYQEEEWPGTDYGLNQMGIEAKVSSFNITELSRKKLVLTGSKTILRLTKW